ncbi:MAG: tetratricopeptide repeat protein [Sandaracinaceae bacterium]
MSSPPGVPNRASAQARPPSDRIARLIARAEALRERGRTDAAWALNRRAVARAPEDHRAVMAMAAALPTEVSWPVDETTRERATAVREAILAAGSGAPPQMQHWLAWSHALAGELRPAVDVAARSVGLQDDAARTWLQRIALLAVRAESLHVARDALRAAHRAMPQDSSILSDLGAVELALGLPEDAVSRFERVLGRRPEDLSARRDLAGALVAAGHATDAVGQLQRCLDAHPEETEIRLELARAALDAGQAAVAEAASRAAIAQLAGDDPRGWTALGDALVARGRGPAAAGAYEEALRRDAGNVRARRGLDALAATPDSRDNP